MRNSGLYGQTAVVLLALFTLAMGQGDPCYPCAKDGMVFNVNDPVGRNSVTFNSSAPLEDIVGTTGDIVGYLVFDPQNPQKGGYGELRVSVASIKTGIPTRDEHLRSADWLDAEKYPQVIMKISKLSDVKKFKETAGSVTYDITAQAEFTLRGITKPISVQGRITFMKVSETTKNRLPGDILAVRSSFNIALADYGIAGPKGMELIGSKVGESIAISVSLMSSTQSEPAALDPNPCYPCIAKK